MKTNKIGLRQLFEGFYENEEIKKDIFNNKIKAYLDSDYYLLALERRQVNVQVGDIFITDALINCDYETISVSMGSGTATLFPKRKPREFKIFFEYYLANHLQLDINEMKYKKVKRKARTGKNKPSVYQDSFTVSEDSYYMDILLPFGIKRSCNMESSEWKDKINSLEQKYKGGNNIHEMFLNDIFSKEQVKEYVYNYFLFNSNLDKKDTDEMLDALVSTDIQKSKEVIIKNNEYLKFVRDNISVEE